MAGKICRKCLFAQLGKKEYDEAIGKHIAVLKEEDRADEKLYNERLSVCSACEKLNDFTCLACGCYVEIRAAMKRSKCPKKKW